MLKHLAILLLLSCSASHKTPNYRVDHNGYTVWRYTSKGQDVKTVLYNGDTVVTTNTGFRYCIKK